ncbi:MAG: DUF4124 domain-containing protein [Candidatus Binatia bacterium]
MRICVLSVILLCFASAARADIFEWQDAEGVRHYTNLKTEVPKEHQETAHVVVDELTRRPAAETLPAVPEQPAGAQPTQQGREAQVADDRSMAPSAYVEGLERGLELGRTINAGGTVQITGPLAVASTIGPAPYYASFRPYSYYPLVTTSFDRGRSRHLTLRMLLEDQFAIDQEGPFVFAERLLPPFGYRPLDVARSPFLARGLPHGFPRD